MKIVCYTFDDKNINIEPAPSKRDWIEGTVNGFARRCLPLVTANAHGWQVMAEDSCEIVWTGGKSAADLTVSTASGSHEYVSSHFGYGVVTFQVNGLFRTEPGINLWITGPVNTLKDGIQPLSGLIETDWMPYTFTMNWQVTRKNTVIKFEKGEPICQFFPVPRGIVDQAMPEFTAIEDNPDLNSTFSDWRKSRYDIIQESKSPSNNNNVEFQMFYFRGTLPSGKKAINDHQTKIKPKKFKKRESK